MKILNHIFMLLFCFSLGINCVRATQSRPSAGSLFSVTSKGEVCVFDPRAEELAGSDAVEKKPQNDLNYSQAIPVAGRPLPIVCPLDNGFGEGSSLYFQIKMKDDATRFSINLQTGKASSEADIALHFNPRLDQNKVVMNDRQANTWGNEEMQPLIIMQEDSSALKVFNQGHSTQVLIKCEPGYFQVKYRR